MIWIHTITPWIDSKFHSKFHSVESHEKSIFKLWFEIVPQHHDFISWIHTTSWIHTMMYRYEFMTASAFYLFLVGANSYTKAWIHKKNHDFIPWIHTANAFYLFLVGANSCFFVWIHSIFHEIYVWNSGMIHPNSGMIHPLN